MLKLLILICASVLQAGAIPDANLDNSILEEILRNAVSDFKISFGAHVDCLPTDLRWSSQNMNESDRKQTTTDKNELQLA